MVKYIFKLAYSEGQSLKISSSGQCIDSSKAQAKKLRLLSVDNKKIEFCGPYFGSCCIFRDKKENIDKLKYFVHKAKYNIRGKDFCDSWTNEELHAYSVPLKDVTVKVILDDQCEYQISLYYWSNPITLPRSLLISKNLDLKRYYNKKIHLSIGDTLEDFYYDGIAYTAKVMYDNEEVCKLANVSVPVYYKDDSKVGKGGIFSFIAGYSFFGCDEKSLKNYVIVIEKDGEGELLVYLANREEEPIDIKGNVINIRKIYDHTFNVSLKTALLENSNIREVLPELEIDDSVNLDKRKLNCLISKMHNAVATNTKFHW